jgi:hypothetical protein
MSLLGVLGLVMWTHFASCGIMCMICGGHMTPEDDAYTTITASSAQVSTNMYLNLR